MLVAAVPVIVPGNGATGAVDAIGVVVVAVETEFEPAAVVALAVGVVTVVGVTVVAAVATGEEVVAGTAVTVPAGVETVASNS